ncbi:Piso0_002357 [Millerozyma farinosa CBS 7064]|uniref:Piso0_002357 protein n=1 Tax=Pichia sorbitophila (strain ATCC MYA-4447 / BCRC 22081 / CBS 7064 / NBRC 10061 / NRRL Y-12695) TaxID=559304 RepID=G8YCE3_PICSO|nr:Piso0_002357 [Millerozyma farinosa CBS 7064]
MYYFILFYFLFVSPVGAGPSKCLSESYTTETAVAAPRDTQSFGYALLFFSPEKTSSYASFRAMICAFSGDDGTLCPRKCWRPAGARCRHEQPRAPEPFLTSWHFRAPVLRAEGSARVGYRFGEFPRKIIHLPAKQPSSRREKIVRYQKRGALAASDSGSTCTRTGSIESSIVSLLHQ